MAMFNSYVTNYQRVFAMLVGSSAKFLWFPSQFQCWHKAVSSPLQKHF